MSIFLGTSSPLPKLVLLEAGREKLAPIARKLAQKLEARFWQLEFDDFDEHPFRWYPKPEDIIRLENIRKGRLVGFRKSLNPVLDSDNRHKPSLGGYRSLNPPFHDRRKLYRLQRRRTRRKPT